MLFTNYILLIQLMLIFRISKHDKTFKGTAPLQIKVSEDPFIVCAGSDYKFYLKGLESKKHPKVKLQW